MMSWFNANLTYRAMAISLVIMCGRTGSVISINLMSHILFNYCTSWIAMNAILYGFGIFICYYILGQTKKHYFRAVNSDPDGAFNA